ncbi:unnamed protein product [Acanthoscelides obtectus]|uniref:Uncharacterized protein n=1 Tax=Acanthoscelides obtectus TaxID=200917 RepID=A0A9P0KKX0_ACAOB|nr:unnamed protein product [Acanthoscelides obtectus]CAK1656530.1 hypothetical protein AOBTE_LOCUS19777 [Acanthoscelides obtectus]
MIFSNFSLVIYLPSYLLFSYFCYLVFTMLIYVK